MKKRTKCLTIAATAKAQYTIALEEELRTEVFTSYSKQQRPAKIVTLSLSLTILTVNELVSCSFFLLCRQLYVYYTLQFITVGDITFSFCDTFKI